MKDIIANTEAAIVRIEEQLYRGRITSNQARSEYATLEGDMMRYYTKCNIITQWWYKSHVDMLKRQIGMLMSMTLHCKGF